MDTKVILDTNVHAKAATAPNRCPKEELIVQKNCMDYVYGLIKGKTKLVLDADYVIFREYQNNVDNTSSMGKLFFKWIYQYSVYQPHRRNFHCQA